MMKRVTSVLANLTLLISISLLVSAFLVPPLFKLTFEPILGSSMEPTIKLGALVVIKKAAPEDIKVGDIIAFKVQEVDPSVVHRVIGVITQDGETGYRTRGDANYKDDDWIVKPDNLIGEVVLNLSWFGYIAKFAKSSYGFGLLIGLPAATIIIVELRSMFGSKHKRKRLRPKVKSGKIPIFLVIITGVLITCVLWGLMAVNVQEKTLDSIAMRSSDVDQPAYLARRNIQNKGILPLVICLFSEDETVIFSEDYFWLSPGSQNEVEISGNDGDAIIKTGGLFPMLPERVLYTLFRWNSLLAPLIVAAVWILPLTIGAIITMKRFSYAAKPINKPKYLKSIRGNA